MDCWSTVKKWGRGVINPKSSERCVGDTRNKSKTENEGQISLFSGGQAHSFRPG